MTPPPAHPKIYHITHVDNLADIVVEGRLVSDAEMLRRGGPRAPIGMSGIKRRRVEEIEVTCHPGAKVGEYVPFYFCPRPVMLFVIFRANYPELAYKGGKDLSCISKPTCTMSSAGPNRLAGGGLFHCPTPDPTLPNSAQASKAWTSLIGTQSPLLNSATRT